MEQIEIQTVEYGDYNYLTYTSKLLDLIDIKLVPRGNYWGVYVNHRELFEDERYGLKQREYTSKKTYMKKKEASKAVFGYYLKQLYAIEVIG